MQRAADDFDAINARLRELRGAGRPTSQALAGSGIAVDVQWYEYLHRIGNGQTVYAYKPVSDRARTAPKLRDLYYAGDFAHWPLMPPQEMRKSCQLPEDFVFEEIPAP